MVDTLAARLADDDFWDPDVDSGTWWLRLHAVMILGLIPGERAGLVLVAIMRRMALAGDVDLQDWCAGLWPAFFRNKPDSVLPALRAVCTDQELDCYIRVNALEPVLAAAQREGPAALEDALVWIAGLIRNEDDAGEFRFGAATTLLSFPRGNFRPLLAELAGHVEPDAFAAYFDHRDIEEAYRRGTDQATWAEGHFADPWRFYTPEQIAARQQRWAEEEMREAELLLAEFPETYVRSAPKVGRNDPCPCGSGKKYKKCCLYRK